MTNKKPKIAIVKLSTIAKSPGMRLDPGYYLSTNEERDVERANKRMRHSIKRLWRVYTRYLASRWCKFVWWITGEVR